MMGQGSVVLARTPSTLEAGIKSSYLFKFAPFVEWPVEAGGDAGRSFAICISGTDPFGPVLDDVVRGQKFAGRAVTVRRLGTGGLNADCRILFVGRPDEAGTDLLAQTSGKPVLTVSDQGATPAGTMIEFMMQNGRVRFRIDEGSARASGLRISSKLLALATSVDRKTGDLPAPRGK